MLGFWNELYIAESMCIENQQLFYRCCKLKALKKSCLCWFFNSFFLFWNELYIAESMRIENQQLFYRCCKLKALEINILSICVSISYHWDAVSVHRACSQSTHNVILMVLRLWFNVPALKWCHYGFEVPSCIWFCLPCSILNYILYFFLFYV